MVEFNLFPWREQLRFYQKQVTKRIILFSFVVSFFVMTALDIFITHFEDRLGKRVHHLQRAQKTLVSIESPKPDIPSNLSQPLAAHKATLTFFSFLNKSINRGVCFTGIKQMQNNFFLKGYASSISDLLTFSRAWQDDSAAHEIKIASLTYIPSKKLLQFTVHMNGQ